jgi:hypothetical protein
MVSPRQQLSLPSEIANNSYRQMLDFNFAPLTLPEFDYEVEA